MDGQRRLRHHKYLPAYHHRRFQSDLKMRELELQKPHLLQINQYLKYQAQPLLKL